MVLIELVQLREGVDKDVVAGVIVETKTDPGFDAVREMQETEKGESR